MAVREAAVRLKAIVDTAVDGIITIDENGIVESMNLAAERLFGFARDEVIGSNVKMLMPEPYRSEHDGYLTAYLTTGQKRIIGSGREVVGLRKDGSTFPMDLAVSETRLGSRRIFTGIVRDITERKRLEEELRAPTSARTTSSPCSPTSCETRWRRSATPFRSCESKGRAAPTTSGRSTSSPSRSSK